MVTRCEEQDPSAIKEVCPNFRGEENIPIIPSRDSNSDCLVTGRSERLVRVFTISKYKSRGVSSQCPRALRYASSAASASPPGGGAPNSAAAGSLELRELRRHNYKAAVLPNKSASYLHHRRTRSARGMNMGQKISGNGGH
ncbi:unnamed protein product [Timema podura]|uniref:Uncharacterized protein n=1 Tax=Timema podura TaxID=61482 RepID=A0ABN7NSS5_TIMPD|nr:unnamed protein product [Timema podura]